MEKVFTQTEPDPDMLRTQGADLESRHDKFTEALRSTDDPSRAAAIQKRIDDLDAKHAQVVSDLEAIPAPEEPPPLTLDERIEQKFLDQIAAKEAEVRVIKKLQDEGKIAPEPVRVVDGVEVAAKQEAAVDALHEVLYDQARLDLESQLAVLSTDAGIELLKTELGAPLPALPEPPDLPPTETAAKPTLKQRIFGGA